MPDLITGFALVAVVLVVAGLTSGVVERAPLSFPIIFLGLGFLIGGHGLGVLEIGAEDPVETYPAPVGEPSAAST